MSDADREDFDQIAYYDSILTPHEDSVRERDVEQFIFSLSYNESVALLFLALGYKRKEIAPILGYQNSQNITQMMLRMREIAGKEQF